jgi:hypothetical protein
MPLRPNAHNSPESAAGVISPQRVCASHVAMLSQPDEVAAFIARAAE